MGLIEHAQIIIIYIYDWTYWMPAQNNGGNTKFSPTENILIDNGQNYTIPNAK